MMKTGKGRGWNLKKGAKDYDKCDRVEAGRKGGSVCCPKGFALSGYNKQRISRRNAGVKTSES